MAMRWMLAAGVVVLGVPAIARAEAAASFEPSRISGVAPLAVYFDASASSCDGCAGVVNPWHDLAYRWDFGDPVAGTWALSGLSKATDIGPSAAHVFEHPGHYVIELTVTDPVSGQTATTTQEIDVADPEQVFAGDKTLCYRASDGGDFDGCPAGAQQKTMASFTAAYADCKASEHRCLFRRGDTFTAATSMALDGSAPTIIGAFGEGPRPVVDASGLGMAPLFQGGGGGDDYRIMDLSLIGPKVKSAMVYGAKQPQKNALLLRVEGVADTWHNFNEMEQSKLGTKGWHENIFLVECTVLKAGFGAGGNIVFVTYKKSALLGNDFQDTRKGEHIVRAGAYDDFLIAHNRLGAAAGIRSVVTLRSPDADVPCQGGVCAPSRRGHLHANTLHITNGWTVQVCGQAEMQANQCEDTVVDGNFAFMNPKNPLNTDPIVVFNLADGDTVSRRTSFRNNICDLTGAVTQCAALKMATLARAFNNTCFRGDAKAMTCVHGTGSTPNGVSTLAHNNLGFSSGGGMVQVVTGMWSKSDHNLKPASNPFISMMPGADPTMYQLAMDSEAVDGGTAVASGFDFSARPRPAGAALDVGAWEFGAMDPVEPLVVMISAQQNPVAAQAGFTLDATTMGGSGAPSFAWDCDGDGSFETDTAAAATVDCPGLAAGDYPVAVQASDMSGLATASLVLMVTGSCGNAVLDADEQCDGLDLGGQSCVGLGFVGGTLLCARCDFDTSGCDGGQAETGQDETGQPTTGVPTTGDPTGDSQGGTGGASSEGGQADSGSTSDGGGSAGSEGEGGADSEGGCGCRTTPAPAGLVFAGVLLLFRRRRAGGFLC